MATKEKTIREVYDTLTPQQRQDLNFIVGMVIQLKKCTSSMSDEQIKIAQFFINEVFNSH